MKFIQVLNEAREVKECPFCGSDNINWNGGMDTLSFDCFFCASCGAKGPLKQNSPIAALDAWNERGQHERNGNGN